MPSEANHSTAADSRRPRAGFGGVVHDTDTEKAPHRIAAAHEKARVLLLTKDASGVSGPKHDALQCCGQHLVAGMEKLVGDKLIYAAGKALVVYQLEEGVMQFLARPRSGYVKAVSSMKLSNTFRFLAVCETMSYTSTEEERVLSIYDLMAYSRKTVIRSPSNQLLSSCSFSHDDKYVVAAACGESTVHIWNWEKEKLFKSFAVPAVPSRVCCAPCLPLQITTSGENHLRIWAQGQDKMFKSTPLLPTAKEQENFIVHAWLTTIPTNEHLAVRRMAALTTAEDNDDGSKGSIVFVFEGHDDTPIELKQTIFLRMQSSHSADTIAPLTRGFVVGGAGGYLSIFDRADEKREPYQEVRTFAIANANIVSITLQPSEDRLICYCDSNRLLTVAVPPMDVGGTVQSPIQVADLVPGGFHVGPVVGMSLAIQRPLMITVGADRTARVWNYLQGKVELVHNFQAEEPTCIACHFSGFQALVGFKDRIRLYNIAMSELKQCREMFVKGCRDIAYSHGGHMFATNSSMNLVVYCAVSFEQLYSFSGHMNSVKYIAWCHDDLAVVSAGMDGNIYGWDMSSKQRIDLIPQTGRTQPFTGLVVDSREMTRELSSVTRTDAADDEEIRGVNFALVSSNDGTLRRAFWQPGANSSDHAEEVNLDLQGRHVTTMTLAHSKKHVYVGLNDGTLRIYQWPNLMDAPFAEYHLHNKAVVSVQESFDGRALFVCGEDGLVFSCAVFRTDDDSFGGGAQAAERFANTPLGDLMFSDNYNNDVVLLSREEIEDHVNEAIELRKRIEDMRAKHEFDLHQRESELHEELRKLVEQKDAHINIEKDRVEKVQTELEQRIREMMAAQDQRETEHAKTISELENQYEHKLADQLERYDRLSDSMEKMRQQCEGLLELQRKEMEDEINTITNEAKQREKKLRQENKKLREDRTADDNTFREVLDQQEAEYEDELRQLIAAAEKELNDERQTVAKMRTLIQTKNTKIDQMRKKMQELKQAAQLKHEQLQTERQEKKKLQGTIEHYERNLLEREGALAEKEKTILELRNTTKTLENFRFVLDHRLQQLSAERGPITKHIDGLETHIKCMYEEMVSEFENKKHMERELDHKDLKLATSSAELERLRQQIRQKDLYIASFRRELTNVVALTVPTEIQVALKDVYKKFVREEKSRARNVRAVTRAQEALKQMQAKTNNGGSDDETVERPQEQHNEDALPEDVQEELLFGMREAFRQRSYVEKEANALRNRLDWAKRDARRLTKIRLAENSQLMYECNELRRELKLLQRQHDSVQERYNEALKTIQQLRQSEYSARRSPTSSTNAEATPFAYGLGSAPSFGSLAKHDEANSSAIHPATLQAMNPQRSAAGLRTASRKATRQAPRSSDGTKAELEFLHRKLDETERESALQRLEIQRLTHTIGMLQAAQQADSQSDNDLISESSIQIPGLSVKF